MYRIIIAHKNGTNSLTFCVQGRTKGYGYIMHYGKKNMKEYFQLSYAVFPFIALHFGTLCNALVFLYTMYRAIPKERHALISADCNYRKSF